MAEDANHLDEGPVRWSNGPGDQQGDRTVSVPFRVRLDFATNNCTDTDLCWYPDPDGWGELFSGSMCGERGGVRSGLELRQRSAQFSHARALPSRSIGSRKE